MTSCNISTCGSTGSDTRILEESRERDAGQRKRVESFGEGRNDRSGALCLLVRPSRTLVTALATPPLDDHALNQPQAITMTSAPILSVEDNEPKPTRATTQPVPPITPRNRSATFSGPLTPPLDTGKGPEPVVDSSAFNPPRTKEVRCKAAVSGQWCFGRHLPSREWR